MIETAVPAEAVAKLDERQKARADAVLTMISWARAVFSERAHLPPFDPTNETEKFRACSVIGALSGRYAACYREFCASYGIRPTTDYMTAVGYMEKIIRWIDAATGSDRMTFVMRCVGPNRFTDPWEKLTPLDMHIKIMAVYAGYKSSMKEFKK